MTTTNHSLAQQIEGVGRALERQLLIVNGQTVRAVGSKSAEKYDYDRLMAARRTLERLRDAMPEIRAFVDLPPDLRSKALDAVGAKL